eukprot:m.339626 g.339626  ORF g.339626 m.339626 type:complete len:744 (+) comp18889_c0_seq1:208-2439(+)
MGDLDSLLQDFSYLKSLEHKNTIPKKASKKLLLPDKSCEYSVRWHFSKTSEVTFHRIFHRPLGHRCFREFLSDSSYKSKNPTAFMLLEFLREVEDLTSDRPDEAFKTAIRLKKTYLDNRTIRQEAPTLWQKASLIQKFNDNMETLKDKASKVTPNATRNKKLNVNIKDVFMPFTKDARHYLSQDPWNSFLESRFFVRYMQWKQLELNMEVTEADFDVHRILGRGGFGEVFGCRKFDTGALFAMKKLDKKRLKLKHQENSAVHERKVLSEMSSKFVTNLKYAFHDRDTLYLLLDLCEGGDLSWHLKKKGKFTESQAKFYTAEIVMGIAHIHDKKMIYRDLKPANILLDGSGHARISDLGLVRDIKDGKPWPTSECGTHGYMAPEVLQKDVTYGPASDWFSLGCTVFQFFTGYTPFRDPNQKKESKAELTKRVLLGNVTFPEDIPPLAKDFISKLLHVDPNQRLGTRPPPEGAADIRSHPWFSDIDWTALTDHKLKPLIVPTAGMVNASDVHDIERFDFNETRRVKITDEDNSKYYKNFDHIMSHNWQEEVLVMYDLITQEINLREERDERRRKKLVGTGKAFKETGDPPIMQGLMLKQSKRLHFWNVRYVRLYLDRLCWSDDQWLPPKRTIMLKDTSYASSPVVSRGNREQFVHVVKSKNAGVVQEEFYFKCLYPSEYPMWNELLEAAIEDAAPGSNSQRLTMALTPGEDTQQKLSRTESQFGDRLSAEEQKRMLDRLKTEIPE